MYTVYKYYKYEAEIVTQCRATDRRLCRKTCFRLSWVALSL